MVFTKLWWKAAAIRAIKTMCQTAIAIIPAAVTITAVDWLTVAGTAALAGAMSILTSLAGLPEVTERNELEATEHNELAEDKPCEECDLGQYADDDGGEDNEGDA